MDQGLGSVFRRDWDKILANFILAIISLVVSISGFYNEYQFGHVITISIGVFVLSILIYINLYKEGLIILRNFGLITTILLFAGVALSFVVGPNLPTETEYHGWLLPSNEPAPPGWLLPSNEPAPPINCSIEPKEQLAIDFGSNVALFGQNTFRAVIVQVDNTPLIALERDGEKLIFDVDVYDESHEIVARIDRGEFHLNSNKVFYSTRSQDRRRLTVYDNNNNAVLDIIYHNPNYVSITGVFFSKEGTKSIEKPNEIVVETSNNEIKGNCFKNRGFFLTRNGVRVGAPLEVGR